MTEREHKAYHERRLEQQMLDALLRIEELLQPRSVTDRGNYEDRIQPPKEREDVFDLDGHKVGTVKKQRK